MTQEAMKLPPLPAGYISPGMCMVYSASMMMAYAKQAVQEALAEQPLVQQEPLGKVNELFDESVIEQLKVDRELLVYTSPQPAHSQYGSPELQAMIVARTMEKNAAPQPAQQQEPVAWATRMGEYAHIHWGAKRPEYPMVYEVPLYTSPPASKPLTDDEFISMVDSAGIAIDPGLAFEIKEMVEAAHGIKEQP